MKGFLINNKILLNASKHKLKDIPLTEARKKDKNSSYYYLSKAIDTNYDFSFLDYKIVFNSVEFGNNFLISKIFETQKLNENIFFTLFMRACFYEHTDIIKSFLQHEMIKTFDFKNLKHVKSEKSSKLIKLYQNSQNF